MSASAALEQAAPSFLKVKTSCCSLNASLLSFKRLWSRCAQASQQEGEITKSNVAVAIVGKDQPFTMLQGDALQPFVAQMEADQPAEGGGDGGGGGDAGGAAGDGAAEAGDGAAPMEA